MDRNSSFVTHHAMLSNTSLNESHVNWEGKSQMNVVPSKKEDSYPFPFLLVQLNHYEVSGLILISIVGAIMNTVVIATINVKRASRKRITNVFVTSLCVTQFLVAGLVLPTFCLSNAAILHEHVTALSVMSYVCNLCAITWERYVAVKKSLRYNELIPYSSAIKIVSICWAVPVVMQIVPAFWLHGPHAMQVHKFYLVFILVAFLMAPLVYLIYAYTVIYIEVKSLLQREKKISLSISQISTVPESICMPSLIGKIPAYNSTHNVALCKRKSSACSKTQNTSTMSLGSEDERRRSSMFSILSNRIQSRCRLNCSNKQKMKATAKVTYVFITVTFTYIITWFPVIYMTFLEVIGRKDLEPKALKLASAFMIGVNSVVDPLVYGVCLKDVRKELSRICHLGSHQMSPTARL